jgi:hypothetical protein
MDVSGQTPRQLYPQVKSPWHPPNRSLGGPQNRSGRGGEEKNIMPLPGIEPKSSNPEHSHYTDWATPTPTKADSLKENLPPFMEPEGSCNEMDESGQHPTYPIPLRYR